MRTFVRERLLALGKADLRFLYMKTMIRLRHNGMEVNLRIFQLCPAVRLGLFREATRRGISVFELLAELTK